MVASLDLGFVPRGTRDGMETGDSMADFELNYTAQTLQTEWDG